MPKKVNNHKITLNITITPNTEFRVKTFLQ